MGKALVEMAVRMESGEVFSLFDSHGLVVACRKGRLWITRHPSSLDMWLVAGGEARIEGQGHVVIEAAADSTLCLSVPTAVSPNNRSLSGFILRPLLNLFRHRQEINGGPWCLAHDRRGLQAYFPRSGLGISVDLSWVASVSDPSPCSERK